MALFRIAVVAVTALATFPALACPMVEIDGEMIVSPSCPKIEYLESQDVTLVGSSRYFTRDCGGRMLSVTVTEASEGSEADLAVATSRISDGSELHKYTDGILNRLLPVHDVTRMNAQCFDGGTQIGIHIPGEDGQHLNLTLADGRVTDDFDRRARREWYDQRDGIRVVGGERFFVDCAETEAEAQRKCLTEALRERDLSGLSPDGNPVGRGD